MAQVRVRLDEISEFPEKFEEYQSHLELSKEETDDEWIRVRKQFRDQLCNTKANILDENVKAEKVVPSPFISSSTTTSHHYNSFNAMRYPPCALPTFNGDWHQWSSFIDAFNSMFHNEYSNLPNIQRFHYLKSCLNDNLVM